MPLLGKTSIEVPKLCLGGNVFGWTVNEADSFRLLDELMEAGLNFIDTADVYATWNGHPGISETIIGNWMAARSNRKQVIVATKVGKPMGPGKSGLSASYIVEAAEASLSRLRTDYIDLYQSHDDDPKTQLIETLGAYAKLIQSGKVRVIGASNYSADRLQLALNTSREHDLPRYETLQPKYNLYDRNDFESTLAPLAIREQIGVISYYGLASGFLTGKYRTESDESKSVRGKNMSRYMNERGNRILSVLDNVSSELSGVNKGSVNQAQVALAWLMTRPGITAPIASATNSDQLRDLIAATTLELSEQALQTLNEASS